MQKQDSIPTLIKLPKRAPGRSEISLHVNGEVKARFCSLDLARRSMNDLASRLMNRYYPDYHFTLFLSCGDDTLDSIII